MEKATVMALLEKYWQAQTTVGEEQALAAYFQGNQVDPDLLLYSDLFAYFSEEAEVTAGSDFGERILERLGLAADGTAVSAAPGAPEVPVVPAAPAGGRMVSVWDPF